MDQYLFLGLFLVGCTLILFLAFVLYQLRGSGSIKKDRLSFFR